MESNRKIRVIIADDHSIISESLSRMINLMSNMEVLTTCINGEEVVTAAKALAPDLILMDAVMPTMNGVEATRIIKSFNEEIRILMLTTFSDRELIFNAFEAGVDGYLLKDITSEKLMISMKEVMEGGFIKYY